MPLALYASWPLEPPPAQRRAFRAMDSRTPNLRKRVEVLEKALPPPPTPGTLSGEHGDAIDDEIMRLADAIVSQEGRQICEH